MQDYLCRQYVAEEILQGIAGNAESESRSISTGYGSSKSSVMRMDQGSSAYNRWLNKAQIMKKIYDDYDLNIRMHEQPEGFKFKLKNYNEGLQNVGSANRTTNTDDSRKDFYPYEDNILSPSNSVDFVQSHSISFDDTGNGTNTAERMQPSPNVPPVYYGPPQVPPMSYEPSPNMPYGYPAVMPNNYNGYYGPPNLQPPAATVLPSLTSPTPVGTTSNVETLSDDSEQSNEDDNGGIRRGLTATDLYDLVLTAIAFLGFGTFVMNLVMDAMTTQSGATLMMSSAPLLGASVSRDGRQLNPPILEIDELAWTVAKGLDNLIASVDGKAVDCGLAKKLCVKSKKLIKTGTNFSTTLLPAWNVALGWLSNRLGRDTRQPVIMAFLEQCSLPLQCQRNAFK
ncbi:uncharacterized protein LOC126832920 [Adelges cooleyi]|uniref:uncharacterized protein LOC126832920 n=1 Tax=Adelges cooleyi TaxID=133065 RepID=UPI00217F7E2C|nr:uncharacterized protein LOC126832920 [Adelges cooleyi]